MPITITNKPRTITKTLGGLGLALTLLGALACGGGGKTEPPTPIAAAPVIGFFAATPTAITAGQSSTLSWSVTGHTSLTINQGVGTVTGTSQPVSPISTLTYTLTATNATGSSTATATVTVTPVADTQPPSVPTGLVASNLSATGLTLTWTASTDNVGVIGYRVFRGGSQVGTPTGPTFSDTGLTANTLYNYTVAAVDAAGNASAQSAVQPVTTLPVGPTDTVLPTVPTGLAATNIAATTLTLSWTASTDNVGVTGYRVYRGGTLIATVTTGLSYGVTGLTASTAYSFTVTALDAAGNASAQSTALNVSTTAALGEILDESDNVFSILD